MAASHPVGPAIRALHETRNRTEAPLLHSDDEYPKASSLLIPIHSLGSTHTRTPSAKHPSIPSPLLSEERHCSLSMCLIETRLQSPKLIKAQGALGSLRDWREKRRGRRGRDDGGIVRLMSPPAHLMLRGLPQRVASLELARHAALRQRDIHAAECLYAAQCCQPARANAMAEPRHTSWRPASQPRPGWTREVLLVCACRLGPLSCEGKLDVGAKMADKSSGVENNTSEIPFQGRISNSRETDGR
ncbi:hypothetical protein JOQ06_018343, partial [Pogonophryne albipinna]